LLQLRDYTIKHGEMSAWIDEWSLLIAPLRRRHGFHILGAWTIDGADRFIWILNYDGRKTFGQADSDYYESRERKAMSPDPARHIAHSVTRFITSVADQALNRQSV
jgi:hypothetical protein